jgi:hypothetical protein
MSNEAAIAPLSLTDEELDCVMRAAARCRRPSASDRVRSSKAILGSAAGNSRERFTPIDLVACGLQFSE